MRKTITSLLILGAIIMFSAGSSLAGDDKGGMGDKFRGMEKETHMKAFPQGHPVTKNPLNRCFWDEKDSLYFCQYPVTVAN